MGGGRNVAPNRGQLNSFLGLPAGDGRPNPGSLGVGAGNVGVGTNLGVGGGRPGIGAGGVGRPGMGVGGIGRPGVGVGGVGRPGVGVGGAGFDRITPSALYGDATAVRGSFNNWNIYNADWYGAHPGAWYAAGWGAGGAWRAATWNSVASWMNYATTAPVYYDYGDNVAVQGNNVYVDGQNAGTPEQYYAQANSLAATGGQDDATPDGDWLPLGVFALSQTESSTADATVQLAVNKQGVIRGNYTDATTNSTQVVQGAVDKQTQRVAFTVGDDQSTVIETGLYNLTKDESPALIHYGQDRTEQWLLVRLQQPAGAK